MTLVLSEGGSVIRTGNAGIADPFHIISYQGCSLSLQPTAGGLLGPCSSIKEGKLVLGTGLRSELNVSGERRPVTLS